MRKTALLIAGVSLAACAKTESAKTDSAAAMAAAAPAAPAAVTAADMSGTVTGKVMPTNSDSVLFTFSCTSGAGNTSKCVGSNAPKDTITYTYTLSGADSVMFESAPFTPSTPPKSPKLINHVVGHLAAGKWTGTAVSVLAAKPDSVVQRTRWEGSKSQ